MNREIEFRAKDNHGKWRHGSYVKFEGLQGAIYYPIRHSEKKDYIIRTEWCYVDDETVGQYTGLRDKNGVKIFEGDIVHWKSPYGHSFTKAVGHDDACGRFTPLDVFMGYDCEVLGNIYDNPELLSTK